ncbi:MAG: DUF3592 domain-containing protein [Acidobacteriota bacterium]
MRSSVNAQSPVMRFFFSRVFPLIFIAAGAGVAYAGWLGLAKARASTGWPTAPGTVVASSVERRESRGNKGTNVTYHAGVHYEFQVDGATFSGDRVAYGDYGSSSASHARGIVNRYPKGRGVTVHYKPGSPEESLLEPGLKGQTFVLPGIGLIFLLAGLFMAVVIPRSMRREATAVQGTASGMTGGG